VHLSTRDWVATCFVAVAVLAFAVWLMGADSDRSNDVRIIAAIVLALGFVASASAVVPGFDALLHGSKVYLAVTSLLGLAALAAGMIALLAEDELALAVLIATTLVLWAVSTLRHSLAARQPSADPAATRRSAPA